MRFRRIGHGTGDEAKAHDDAKELKPLIESAHTSCHVDLGTCVRGEYRACFTDRFLRPWSRPPDITRLVYKAHYEWQSYLSIAKATVTQPKGVTGDSSRGVYWYKANRRRWRPTDDPARMRRCRGVSVRRLGNPSAQEGVRVGDAAPPEFQLRRWRAACRCRPPPWGRGDEVGDGDAEQVRDLGQRLDREVLAAVLDALVVLGRAFEPLGHRVLSEALFAPDLCDPLRHPEDGGFRVVGPHGRSVPPVALKAEPSYMMALATPSCMAALERRGMPVPRLPGATASTPRRQRFRLEAH